MAQKLNEIYLDVPLSNNDLKKLRSGDIVYLSGTIFTGREGVYRQIFDKGIHPPFCISDLSNVNFHCSPAISEITPGKYKITSVTGTASFRFAKYIKALAENYGIKAIIGKTGMPRETYQSVFKPKGMVYFNTIGYGLGAIYGSGIKRVRKVVWKKELGLAQAMWFFDVERFGPFLVEYDTEGNSLFEADNVKINRKLEVLYEGLKMPILKRLGEKNSPKEEML